MRKGTIISKRKQTVKEQHSGGNDFMSRNYMIYLIMMIVIYPLAAVYSAITEGGHLFSRFVDTMNSTSLALVATIFIVIMIEVGSIVCGKGAADDIVEGVFGEDGAHQRMFAAKLFLFVICFGTSCALSISGSSETTNYIRRNTSPPTLVDKSEINAAFDSRVAIQEASMKDARNMTWKGNIIRNGQKIITEARAEIAKIENERTTALLNADNENNNRQLTWQSDTDETGRWATWISIIGQILMLLSLIVGSIYRAGENNLIANLETITGRDINGDGHIGKVPSSSETTPAAMAAAIHSAMMKQDRENRTVVTGFKRNETPPPPAGETKGATAERLETRGVQPERERQIQNERAAQIQRERELNVQPERVETHSVQPERIIVKEVVSTDVTKLITSARNWYRRNDPRYTQAKAKLEAAGYTIQETSESSLTISK